MYRKSEEVPRSPTILQKRKEFLSIILAGIMTAHDCVCVVLFRIARTSGTPSAVLGRIQPSSTLCNHSAPQVTSYRPTLDALIMVYHRLSRERVTSKGGVDNSWPLNIRGWSVGLCSTLPIHCCHRSTIYCLTGICIVTLPGVTTRLAQFYKH